MSKSEFLSQLRERLKILNPHEIEDIIDEYSQHIDMKMQSGQSEEDAVASFGSVDELARQILEAYNVNPDYDKSRRAENAVGDWIHRFVRQLNNVTENILSRSRNSLVRLFVQFVVLVLVLLVLKLPIDWFFSLFSGYFGGTIFWPVSEIIGSLLWFLFGLLYLAICLYAVYVFLKKNGLLSPAGPKSEDGKDTDMKDNDKTPIKDVITEEVNAFFTSEDAAWEGEPSQQEPGPQPEDPTPGDGQEEPDAPQEEAKKSRRFPFGRGRENRRQAAQPAAVKPAPEHTGADHAFGRLILFALRIIMFFVLIPAVFCVFLIVVAFGAMVVCLFQGIVYFGPMLVILGLLLAAVPITAAITSFVFRGRAVK